MHARVVSRAVEIPSTGTASQTRSIKISSPEWWGLSDFDTEPPLIHVPHWGYYNTHHRLSDEEWDEVIRVTRDALARTYFG